MSRQHNAVKPFLQIVDAGLKEVFGDLKRALDGLDEYELHWRPTLESNSIDWIVWHMAMGEDYWINTRLSERGTVWLSEGWPERSGVFVEGTGFGQTLEQIRAMPELDVALMVEYYGAVRERTEEFFADEIEEADLGRVIGMIESEPITVAGALGHLLAEVGEHLGQVDYVRGMMRGLNK